MALFAFTLRSIAVVKKKTQNRKTAGPNFDQINNALLNHYF